MNIRIATAEDVQSMASAYVAAFRDVDPGERWTVETAAELMKFFLRAQPDLAFVAEVDGELVGGICGMAKPWWDGHHLVQTEIFLDPCCQRRGVGSALFHHFLAVARTRYNAAHMESITFKDLAFPSSWYVRLGFEDKSDWKVIFGDVNVIQKRLGPKSG